MLSLNLSLSLHRFSMLSSQIELIHSTTGKRFSAASGGTVLLSSQELNWRGISVELHQISPQELPEHYVDGHRLLVQVGNPIAFEWKVGDRWRQTLLKPGDFCLLTHGERNTPRWSSPFQFLAIALDPFFVSRIPDTKTPEPIAFQEERGKHDPAIANFAKQFHAELEYRCYRGSLYGESIALAFSLYLLEKYSRRSRSIPRSHGKLSGLQLRQLIEFTHEYLSEDLSLIDLANSLNLSPYHFARLVKSTLGQSPHQYVLQLRIERAKQLMTFRERFSLSEIASQVGFYDHAHFTKAFKRVVGISPKQFSYLGKNCARIYKFLKLSFIKLKLTEL
ncbi:MAG: AraC family transcriptional regulator [Rhizonema sp. PD38]|nr:AraC family transcriptional regulator [Rhizonema sp. PD38]